MISLRYSAWKIWVNYIGAVIAGLIVVLILGSLWDGAALTGGLAGLIAVAGMLLIGCIKRANHQEPIVAIDERGVTVGLPKIETIPRSAIRGISLKGIAWVTGVRLVIDYAGTAPRLGFMHKLNWAVQSKQKGDRAQVSIGLMDLTDQPISLLKEAINQLVPAPST